MDKLKSLLQSPSKAAGTFVLYGKPGIGKTEMAAYFPKPLFICDPSEDGIADLINLGTVPAVEYAKVPTYVDLKELLDELASSKHQYRTVVLETIGGIETLIHLHTYKEGQYKSQKDFERFNDGAKASRGIVRELVEKLQVLRNQGTTVVLTAHAKAQRFSNPTGDDYDTWFPDCYRETWGPIAKWVSNILFLTLDITTEKSKTDLLAKTKGFGEDRVMHTCPNAAIEAKNRYGLPNEVPMGSSGKEAYDNLVAYIKGAKNAQ